MPRRQLLLGLSGVGSWMSERAGSFVMLMSFDPDRRDQERKTKFNNSRCTSKCKKSFIYWRLVNFPCHLEQLVFAPWPDQISSSRDETFEPSRRAAARRAKQDRGSSIMSSPAGNAIGKLGEDIDRNAKRRL